MISYPFDEMVTAMVNDDNRYDGKFFVCVRSTGIYCLPSCKAKLPLLKNVMFVATRHEAVAAGFRGCKRCRAEFYPQLEPGWLNDLIGLMEGRLPGKLNEQEIASLVGVDISTIRRYFKRYLKTTPLAYHRTLRLDHARKLIESGVDALTAGLESGFESLSGFRDAYVKQFGQLPGEHYDCASV